MTTIKLTVIFEHVFPPIPDRRWDWRAYFEGRKEFTHEYGWGETLAGALEDLASSTHCDTVMDELISKEESR